MAELGRRLRQHDLVPIGVQNGTEEQYRAAVNAGWSIFPEGRATALREPAVPAPAATPEGDAGDAEGGGDAAEGSPSPARLLTQPVRSGRQIYAQGGDLVVMASISPGAELLADGHIHVYGALRGRALAGVSGDRSARIFCRSLEAELVSVAGYWQVREDIPESLIGKPAQIRIDGDRLAIEPLA
jgi:septum site-determining protein MinC